MSKFLRPADLSEHPDADVFILNLPDDEWIKPHSNRSS